MTSKSFPVAHAFNRPRWQRRRPSGEDLPRRPPATPAVPGGPVALGVRSRLCLQGIVTVDPRSSGHRCKPWRATPMKPRPARQLVTPVPVPVRCTRQRTGTAQASLVPASRRICWRLRAAEVQPRLGTPRLASSRAGAHQGGCGAEREESNPPPNQLSVTTRAVAAPHRIMAWGVRNCAPVSSRLPPFCSTVSSEETPVALLPPSRRPVVTNN